MVANRIKEKTLALSDRLIEIRRDLHAHPELSTQEFRTAGIVAAILRELGLEVREGVAETGVTGLLRGGRSGPTVAIRADMDALPIQELADAPFKSQVDGVMHACGHDLHTTCGLGAAMALAEVREEMAGDVLFIFQPAEEKNLGANRMVEEGVMTTPKVDMIFGLHNHPEVSAGAVAVKAGALMSAVDKFYLKVTGKGGHGGLPHRDIDPIIAMASVLMNIQTVVSRNVPPLEPAVVSFGTLQGGTANNIIPDFVEATGTVRTYSPETRDLIEKRLKEVASGSAAALGCAGELVYTRELPPVVNDPKAAAIALRAAEAMVGPEKVVDPTPSMGGEDFAVFMEKAPGCFLWLGVGNPAIGAVHPWHSPHFIADESSLAIGAGVLAQCAFYALEELAGR